MVMDVEHSNPDPGTRVISYSRNNPDLVPNQLWMKQFVREGEDTFYLVSKLGPDCKLTLQVIISYCLYFSLHQLNHYFSNLLCGFFSRRMCNCGIKKVCVKILLASIQKTFSTPK